MSLCAVLRATLALLVLLAGALPAKAQGVPAAAAPPAVEAPETASPQLPAPVEPAQTPGATAPEPPPPAKDPSQVLAARWHDPAPSLPARVEAVLASARERGIRSLEPVARLLLLDATAPHPALRAEAAARVAPDLPAAQAALARARLGQGDLGGAANAARAALWALPRHLDASLWLGATGLTLLGWSLVAAGLAFMALCAVSVASRAAHDLGDRLERSTPEFARAALLGSLVLLPSALGEGLLGTGLALFAMTFCYADWRRRVALLAAAALVVAGLHPVLEQAGRFWAAPGADPVAEAAHAAENGLASRLDALRLAHAAPDDPLAQRALALEARRAGDLEQADARYRALLASGAADPAALNNAANVRLARGDSDGAIALYLRAAAESDAPLIWFNLAQAYGQVIRVDEHEAALARAQALDEQLVRELTTQISGSPQALVADLPLPARVARERLLASASGAAATEALRHPMAPGALGAGRDLLAGTFLALAALAAGLSRSFRPSRRCRHCAAHLCPRCRSGPSRGGLCEGCARLLHRPETIDPALRDLRVKRLRARGERRARIERLVACLVPGVAGLLGGRPLLALVAVLAFIGAAASGLGPLHLVPDPISAGLAGRLWFGTAALGLAALYAVATGLALRFPRSSAS